MNIHSSRLKLHRIRPTDAQSIIDGTGRSGPSDCGGLWHPDYPLLDELDPLRMLANTAKSSTGFTLYQIRITASDTAIGGIGFFGPPDIDGSVEVGFGLVEAERGKGFATEALNSLVEYAKANGARKIRADTSVENISSQRVLHKAGFTKTHLDEGLIYYSLEIQN